MTLGTTLAEALHSEDEDMSTDRIHDTADEQLTLPPLPRPDIVQ